jgi:hypothetical protein
VGTGQRVFAGLGGRAGRGGVGGYCGGGSGDDGAEGGAGCEGWAVGGGEEIMLWEGAVGGLVPDGGSCAVLFWVWDRRGRYDGDTIGQMIRDVGELH